MTDRIKAAAQIRALKPEVIPTDACCLATFNLGWRGELSTRIRHWMDRGYRRVNVTFEILDDFATNLDPVDASPAPDPVSKTPALDALAMRTAAVAAIDADGEYVRAIGLSQRIAAIQIDRAAVLAEVRKVPEVRALVDAASEGIAAWRELLALYVGRAGKPDWHGAEMALISDVETAIAKLKGASHE